MSRLLVLVGVAAAVTTAAFAYVRKSLPQLGPEHEGQSGCGAQGVQSDARRDDWKTYSNGLYGFEVSYPSGENLGPAAPEPGPLPYVPLEAFWIMMGRLVGSEGAAVDQHTAPIIIAVHKKPEAMSMREWLSRATPRLFPDAFPTSLDGVEAGTIDLAYAKALRGKKGVVVYTECTSTSGIDFYEIGWADGVYIFGYAVLATRKSLPYVYEVGFSLQGYGRDEITRPTDKEYIALFKGIAESLRLTTPTGP